MKQCWILYEQKKKKIPKIIKKEALLFVPWKGIPSCFLFRWMVRNRITSVFFYFCSTARNSELFSLLWNGSERNSESSLCAEQPEFRQNQATVPSIPECFCRKLLTLERGQKL
jgi:hypothetical protein